MGERGPVPKRSTQRRRANAPTTPIAKLPAARKVPVPRADADWHPVALQWYQSLAKSGQAAFYEPSDWAVAFLIAESMSRDLGEQVVGVIQEGKNAGDVIRDTIPLKGASLSAYLRAMSVLLVTEGDRRRLHVELQQPNPGDPDAEQADGEITSIMSRLGG